MAEYLDFREARCRDCYLCLRECPVKAIAVINHQARIIDDRCILCGNCTLVCPQNAKVVHSELEQVKQLLAGNKKVIASVAPSFIANFDVADFSTFKIALCKLGFFDAEETAVGARIVTQQYRVLMESGQFKNFITSACPAACQMIQHYFPKALKYLAPVDSPMFAHAKLLHKQYDDAEIVFIGPCIAKKKEARESQMIANVLTFEELELFFKERNINLDEMSNFSLGEKKVGANLAKSYPISHGIINSFGSNLPEGFEYMAVDGADRCVDLLENIESLSGMFIELNACKDACVAGPCSLKKPGGSIRATATVRDYVANEVKTKGSPAEVPCNVDLSVAYPRIRTTNRIPTEDEIKAILAKTGKFKPEDELNCGSCGYTTCREKAWAVFNGYSDVEVCFPYLRQQAESMSYEIMQSNPDGIVVLDDKMNIMVINDKARELLGIDAKMESLKGMPAVDYFNPSDFMITQTSKKPLLNDRQFIPKTGQYVDLSISPLKGHNMLCGVLKDVTAKAGYEERLKEMKMKTLDTTDEVIMRQMRVAQEIASLLGETTAETKVALLKLKKTLQEK
ncbi:MAG: [Fe-Fe] hydrogenase large subunit C-terminal domain-containing protein [Bacteroidales bacterium]|nr:[Fe-Fe] hydrogenase large subunit C-terminal domain-containing protein [Bacteroidales bacterium]